MIAVAVPMPAPPDLHRHVNDQDLQLPCLMAAAVLTVTRARTRTADAAETGLVPASPVLRATVIPIPRRDLDHVLHWSAWRRRRQHRATACHRRWNNVTAAATT
jgi:hypothetical protein